MRRYRPALIASTDYTVDEGTSVAFRRVAAFIFGGNTSTDDAAKSDSLAMTVPVATSESKKSESIAMTVPVATSEDTTRQVMWFYMPKKYTAATLPTPTDNRVKIEIMPERVMACLTFSGSGEDQKQEMFQQLCSAVKRTNKFEVSGEPVLFQDNPPWTLPWLRTNEVLVNVAELQK